MAAFARAIAAGVDGIELDIHLSKDRKLVVHHDESLKPAIARGPDGAWLTRPTPLLKELTHDEMRAYDIGRLRPGARYAARYPDQVPADGERIPLLAEVYALAKEKAKPGFRLYVELKTALLDLSQSADPRELADAAVGLGDVEVAVEGPEPSQCSRQPRGDVEVSDGDRPFCGTAEVGDLGP